MQEGAWETHEAFEGCRSLICVDMETTSGKALRGNNPSIVPPSQNLPLPVAQQRPSQEHFVQESLLNEDFA